MSNLRDSNDDLNIDKHKDSVDKEHQEFEEVCYLCRRPESKVGKMIHIPNQITICGDCMQKTFDTINKGDNPYMQMMGFPPNMLNMSNLQNDIPKSQKLKSCDRSQNNPYSSTYNEVGGTIPISRGAVKEIKGHNILRVFNNHPTNRKRS